MRPQRGIMLLEVGVAITATAAALYSAVFLFSSFQRIDRSARERLQLSRELMRLAEQFKSDVYVASKVGEADAGKAAGGKLLVRLEVGESEQVEYKVDEKSRLMRTVTKANTTIERDSFEFGPGADFAIEQDRTNPGLITLILTMSNDAERQIRSPVIERRVTALLSRDQRYKMSKTNNAP